ncbi:hypothetical protein BU14_0289s0022 [Porphyra umbilicalis]|uniref:NAD-dependent epimerase/dehydratase domain-containing protein n=1 Tax=Porphyra umbilicalis TaxID=2786 RepID=A0A1X6P1D9_PORUM|nr:hypothetical protein BU14_0289s0022 [Porphyra umbilicalis]|eukprot:OSX74443.1 hypothetical protein BU14_0289s0022 [Porphyra umbilicalis]
MRALTRGHGGRASVSGVTASVFGGTGFLGRYVVNALGRIGSQVVTPYRGDELESRRLRLMGDLGQIVPMPFELRDAASVGRAVAPSSVVINLIGKAYPTRYYTLEQAHVDAPRTLARAAAEAGAAHFVHVSTVAPPPSAVVGRSEWFRTKAAGEAAVREEFPTATIVRVTEMFGAEDRFLTRMGEWTAKYRAVFMAGDGTAPVQPVHVRDVAAAVATAARDVEGFRGRDVEVGGADVVPLAEVVEFVKAATKRDVPAVAVPTMVMEAAVGLTGKRLPFVNATPRWSVEDVRREAAGVALSTTPAEGVLRLSDMGIVPVTYDGEFGEEVLRRFHKGGDRSALFYTH